MELPVCGNFLSGACEKSNVFVSRETDEVFVITCKTCGGVNVWPKDRTEGAAKYQNFLKHKAEMERQQRREGLETAFSFRRS